MTDDDKALVERLEEWEWTLRAVYKAGDLGTDEPAIVMGEAADRIEALSAEIERLREALNEIKRLLSYANQDAVNEAIAQGNKNMAWHKARAALGDTK